jgi:hypothetical protein
MSWVGFHILIGGPALVSVARIVLVGLDGRDRIVDEGFRTGIGRLANTVEENLVLEDRALPRLGPTEAAS